MRPRKLPRTLCLLLSLSALAPAGALAHPAPFSYLDVVFRDGGIEGSLVVHVIDVAYELGLEPEDVMDDALVQRELARIGEILSGRIVLRGSGALEPEWERMPSGAEMIFAIRAAARSTSGNQSLHAVIDLVCHSSKNSPRSSLAWAGTQPSECEMK
jgi:hypothetical protein